jgi:hypothetical protein
LRRNLIRPAVKSQIGALQKHAAAQSCDNQKNQPDPFQNAHARLIAPVLSIETVPNSRGRFPCPYGTYGMYEKPLTGVTT